MAEMRGRITALANSCLDETGATPEMVNKAMDGDFPEDSSFKELLYCMGKEQHFIDSSDMVDESKIKAAMKELVGDEALANSLVDKCLSQSGTPQDRAYNTVKCMYSQSH
nr:unnamed protein product [Callosobruchus chinensis]